MAVMKRLTAQVGSSRRQSAHTNQHVAKAGGWICPHCHNQSKLVDGGDGRKICLLCDRSPVE